MKKIILLAVITTFMISCKKEKPTEPPAPSLIGKWAVVNYQTKEWNNGSVVYDDNYVGTTADFMEFKSDNTISFFMDGFGATVNYQLQPDNKVAINGDTYTVQSLTANNATLYLKTTYSNTNYDEEIINLKR